MSILIILVNQILINNYEFHNFYKLHFITNVKQKEKQSLRLNTKLALKHYFGMIVDYLMLTDIRSGIRYTNYFKIPSKLT